MLSGWLHQALTTADLREAIIHKHGQPTVSTVLNNETDCPIDGIWCLKELEITRGGYLPYAELVPRTNHRTLWIEFSFATTFGCNMPEIIRPKMRRLQCNDPRCVDNYIKTYKGIIRDQNLLQRARHLENMASYPLSATAQALYEELDVLRCRAAALAEKSCRELRAGQVAFSPTIKALMNQIKA